LIVENKPKPKITVAPAVHVVFDCKEAQKGPRRKVKRGLLPEDEALLWAWRWKWIAITGTVLALAGGVLIGRFLLS
jgi:hypothetical protein